MPSHLRLGQHGRNTTLWSGFSFGFRRALRGFDLGEYEVVPAERRQPAKVAG